MRDQVEKRLKFLEEGGEVEKNTEAMDEVMQELVQENNYANEEEVNLKRKKKDKKKKKKQVQ